MKNMMMKLWKDEEGASMVEYVLLVALIAVVAVIAVRTLGSSVSTKFGDANTELNTK